MSIRFVVFGFFFPPLHRKKKKTLSSRKHLGNDIADGEERKKILILTHLIHAGMRSTHSPYAVSTRALTFVRCGIAEVPSAASGKKRLQTPNSSLTAQCSALGSQPLNSPTSATALAPGAHSRYQIPGCLPPSPPTPRLNPYFSYPLENSSSPPSLASIAERIPLKTFQRYLKWSACDHSESSHFRHSVPSEESGKGLTGCLGSEKGRGSARWATGAQRAKGSEARSTAVDGDGDEEEEEEEDFAPVAPALALASAAATGLPASWISLNRGERE